MFQLRRKLSTRPGVSHDSLPTLICAKLPRQGLLKKLQGSLKTSDPLCFAQSMQCSQRQPSRSKSNMLKSCERPPKMNARLDIPGCCEAEGNNASGTQQNQRLQTPRVCFESRCIDHVPLTPKNDDPPKKSPRKKLQTNARGLNRKPPGNCSHGCTDTTVR
jgi:hypothetical protein